MKSKKFLYLEKAIGVDFNDFEILKTSMIHKSYNNNVNNEKRSGIERRDEDRRSGGERRHD